MNSKYLTFFLFVSLATISFFFYKVGMNLTATICWFITGILFFVAIRIHRLDIAVFSLLVGFSALAFMLATYHLCAIENQELCTMAQVDDLQKTQWEKMKRGEITELKDVKWKDIKSEVSQ